MNDQPSNISHLTSNFQRPLVGIGVMVIKDGKVLLHKRKGSFGEGEYAFPGGHLEYMESFEECAHRETREEAGIEIQSVRFQYAANFPKEWAPKHYVGIGLIADWKSGEPSIMEPDKNDGGWAWYDPDHLPSPLLKGAEYAIESYKTGKNYFDA